MDSRAAKTLAENAQAIDGADREIARIEEMLVVVAPTGSMVCVVRLSGSSTIVVDLFRASVILVVLPFLSLV